MSLDISSLGMKVTFIYILWRLLFLF